MVGRVLAWLQAPVGGARPTLGLLQTIAEQFGVEDALRCIVDGRARAAAYSSSKPTRARCPNSPFKCPCRWCWPCAGRVGAGPRCACRQTMSNRIRLRCSRPRPGRREALHAGSGVLAVRSGHPREARAAAGWWLGSSDCRPRSSTRSHRAEWVHGCGCAAPCRSCVPSWRLARRGACPICPDIDGPLLLATGMDGSFEREGDPVGSWRVPVPPPAERVALWKEHLEPEAAEVAARAIRYFLGSFSIAWSRACRSSLFCSASSGLSPSIGIWRRNSPSEAGTNSSSDSSCSGSPLRLRRIRMQAREAMVYSQVEIRASPRSL